jgi:hypothetical protein
MERKTHAKELAKCRLGWRSRFLRWIMMLFEEESGTHAIGILDSGEVDFWEFWVGRTSPGRDEHIPMAWLQYSEELEDGFGGDLEGYRVVIVHRLQLPSIPALSLEHVEYVSAANGLKQPEARELH